MWRVLTFVVTAAALVIWSAGAASAGTGWLVQAMPSPPSSPNSDNVLDGVSCASSVSCVAVGSYVSSAGIGVTLAEYWNGSTWSVLPTPDPGSTGNHLYGVDAVAPNDVWAVGQQLGAKAPEQGLVEHWNGQKWSVVSSPVSASASVMLDAVTVAHGQVWTAGEADSPASGGRPIIERLSGGHGQVVHLPASAGNNWTNLYGLAPADGAIWAVGTFVDPTTDNSDVLVLRLTGGKWTINNAPNAGGTGGSDILGGVTNIDGQLWMAGMYNTASSNNLPLIEHR